MATNRIEDGDFLTLVAPSGGVTSGTPVVIGGIVVVPQASAAVGVKFSGDAVGVYDVPKQAALSISAGDKVYWDAGAGEADKTSTNTFMGVCTLAAGASDTTVRVRLNALGMVDGVDADTLAGVGGAALVGTSGGQTVQASLHNNVIADPGDAGAISVVASGYCAMTSAGAETRTVAIPAFVGQRLILTHDTDGGSIAVTFASAIDEDGSTIATFADVDDTLELVGVSTGGTRRWQVVHNEGVILNLQSRLADPGDTGAIPVDRSGHCALTTGGAGQTRTVAIPSFVGQWLRITLDTDGGGDAVVTFSQAVNGAGGTIATLDDAGDFLDVVAISVGGALRWRLVESDGVTWNTAPYDAAEVDAKFGTGSIGEDRLTADELDARAARVATVKTEAGVADMSAAVTGRATQVVAYEFDFADSTGGTFSFDNIPHGLKIIDVFGRKTGGAGGAGDTVQIQTDVGGGQVALFTAISLNVADGARIAWSAGWDDAQATLATGDDIDFVFVDGNAGATDLSCELTILCLRQ